MAKRKWIGFEFSIGSKGIKNGAAADKRGAKFWLGARWLRLTVKPLFFTRPISLKVVFTLYNDPCDVKPFNQSCRKPPYGC